MAVGTAHSMQIATISAILAAASIAAVIYAGKRRTSHSKSTQTTTKKKVATNKHENQIDYYQHLGIPSASLPPHILRNIAKERRRKSKAEFLSMKSPMYDNVFMSDPDGNLMCTISLKKAKWYVGKGIAEWYRASSCKGGKDEDDAYIRLLFQPNNGKSNNSSSKNASKSDSESTYLQSPKLNICVSCGSDGYHMRHYIVPYSYRSGLPEEYKSHMSHDIVIVCPECHVHIDRETKRRMNRIEGNLRDEMNKTDTGREYWCSPVIEDTYLYRVRSCAVALVKWRDAMPADRVASHEREVREYLASRSKIVGVLHEDVPLTKAQLQSVCAVNYRIKNPEYIAGSELVVKSLNCEADKIEAFIKEWRQYFIDTVRPKFMPKGWCVDNPVVCGRS